MRLILAIFLFATVILNAQPNGKSIQLRLRLNNQQFELNKSYLPVSKKDSIKIETLKFFISNIELSLDGKVAIELDKKHHLIDSEKPGSLHIFFTRNSEDEFNTIKFNVGIDSITNVSGAYGGDLDPTNGMYWTWQSGYVNFKLEGKSSECPTRNRVFQFHLGGYQFPVNTLQPVELKTTDSENIIINVELDSFLSKIDLGETHTVMSPNQKAVALSQLLSKMFSIQNEN